MAGGGMSARRCLADGCAYSKQAGAAPGADDETPSEPKRAKGDVVDAEFEEVGDSRS